jgi:hypothetical protein
VLIRLDVATDWLRRLFRPCYPVTISASCNRAAALPQDSQVLLSRALRWYYVPPLCITTVAELLAFSRALRCFAVLCRAPLLLPLSCCPSGKKLEVAGL